MTLTALLINIYIYLHMFMYNINTYHAFFVNRPRCLHSNNIPIDSYTHKRVISSAAVIVCRNPLLINKRSLHRMQAVSSVYACCVCSSISVENPWLARRRHPQWICAICTFSFSLCTSHSIYLLHYKQNFYLFRVRKL